MPEFRFDINAQNNSNPAIDRAIAKINEFKTALSSLSKTQVGQGWGDFLKAELGKAEAALQSLGATTTATSATGSAALRDFAAEGQFMSRRMRQSLGETADSFGQLDTAAVKAMLNVSKAGQDLAGRQAQVIRRVVESNAAEIERITGKPQILGLNTNVQPITALNSVFANLHGEMDAVDKAGKRVAGTLGLNRMGFLELEAAGVNTFQALASGMNPLHVAMMESAQVMGALVQGGLIPSTSIISALASPIGIATASIVALTAAMAYAAYTAYESRQNMEGIRGTLLLTGDAAKVSEKEITEWQTKLRVALGASRSEAFELGGAFGSLYGSVGQNAKAFLELALIQARLKGSAGDVSEEIKRLQSAVKGGVAGLVEYIKELKGGTEQQREFIIQLANRGKVEEAISAIRSLTNEIDSQGRSLVEGQRKWRDYFTTLAAASVASSLPGGGLAGLLPTLANPPRGTPYSVKDVINNPVDVSGFQAKLQEMITDAASKGIMLGLGKSSRTFEEQTSLWQKALAKYGSPELARKWVAPPGSSMHEIALANDLKDSSGRAIQRGSAEDRYLAENASRFGLTRPMGNEPWHVEPQGGRQTQTANERVGSEDATKRLKVETDISVLVDQRNVALIAAGREQSQAEKDRYTKAAEVAEIQLRSMHTPQQEAAHRLKMAQLDKELQASQQVAEKDSNNWQQVVTARKNIQDAITDYAQGATLNRTEFTRKESADEISAAWATSEALRGQSRAQLQTKLDNIAKARVATASDASAQIIFAQQELDVLRASGIEKESEVRSKELEILRIRQQASQQSFTDFMQAKNNEIREAKGSADKISSIIDEMRVKAKSSYQEGTRDFKRTMEDIERIQIEATQRSVQSRIQEANRANQISQIEVNQEKRRLDQQVTLRNITQQEALQQEAGIIKQKAQINLDALNRIIDDEKTNEDQRKQLRFERLQLEEQVAEKIESINKRIIEANEKDLQRQMADYKTFFSSVGSAASSYLEAAILKTSTFAEANKKLLESLGKAALDLAGNVASKSIAGAFGGKAGEGITDVLAREVGGWFSSGSKTVELGGQAGMNAALVSGTASMTAFSGAVASATAVLGGQSAAVGASTAATSTEAAVKGTATAATTGLQVANVGNTLATTGNTVATVANSTAQTGGAAASAVGGTASAVGGVGSAVGGVAGTAAGFTPFGAAGGVVSGIGSVIGGALSFAGSIVSATMIVTAIGNSAGRIVDAIKSTGTIQNSAMLNQARAIVGNGATALKDAKTPAEQAQVIADTQNQLGILGAMSIVAAVRESGGEIVATLKRIELGKAMMSFGKDIGSALFPGLTGIPGLSSGIGLLGAIGSFFFEKGGIVPSAAGGMISAGGLSILHPREMVLPENISTGLQNMISQGNQNNSSSSTFNYNANVTGYHPYATRSGFESMLRQHGSTLASWAENIARNGRLRAAA